MTTTSIDQVISALSDIRRPSRQLAITDKYLDLYYFELLDEFQALPTAVRAGLDQDTLNWLASLQAKQIGQQLELHEVFRLETLIIAQLPSEALRRRAWNLREKYREAFPTRYDAYINSKPPITEVQDAAGLELLRADLIRLTEEFHWLYATTYTREQIRQKISGYIALAAGAFAVAGIGLLMLNWVRHWQLYLPMPIDVFLAGVMGGIISTEFRLQNKNFSGSEPIADLVQLNQGRYSIYISPILGGVFAVILYVMIAGQLVSGSLFPRVTPSDVLAVDFWYNTVPESGQDLAKLLIWSFLAGFAERLVPDALDRIAATASKAS